MLSRRWSDAIVLQWSLLLALVVALPWGRSGFLLSYDMLAVPRWSLDRHDLWGLGSALPRAVPSDGVVAVLTQVVDPQLLQRLVLIAALAAGGVGAARVVQIVVPDVSLGARLVAATYAAWNPFVAERLALGHWPVLVALACLPWLVVALRSSAQTAPRDREPAVRWALVVLMLAGTALSPATGVMGLVTALAVGRRAGVVRLTVVGLLVNAPWLTATLVRLEPVVSDPGGVVAFAAQPEGPFGRWGALLALGGVWNGEVVPTSRGTGLTAFLVVVVWALVVVGVVRWWRAGRRLLGPLGGLAVLGYLLAVAGWWAPGLLEDAIAWNGAAGIVRDGTRYLALAVPFHAVALALGAAALGRWIAARVDDVAWAGVGTALAVALPLAALPDLANGVGGRVTPVEYPEDWSTAAQVIADSEVPGSILVLPFAPYRAPAWNEGRTVIDPAGRFFDRDTIVSDALTISGVTLASEDPLAEEVAATLADPAATAADLAALGIGLVVVDLAAPGGADPVTSLTEASLISQPGSQLQVYAIAGARVTEVSEESRVAVTAAWVVAAVTVGLALLSGLLRGLGAAVSRGRR